MTFEWAAIQGENDDEQAARKLGKLLKRHSVKDAHVNVIPLNPTKGFSGKKSSNVDTFCRTPYRTSLGSARRRACAAGLTSTRAAASSRRRWRRGPKADMHAAASRRRRAIDGTRLLTVARGVRQRVMAIYARRRTAAACLRHDKERDQDAFAARRAPNAAALPRFCRRAEPPTLRPSFRPQHGVDRVLPLLHIADRQVLRRRRELAQIHDVLHEARRREAASRHEGERDRSDAEVRRPVQDVQRDPRELRARA